MDIRIRQHDKIWYVTMTHDDRIMEETVTGVGLAHIEAILDAYKVMDVLMDKIIGIINETTKD